MKFSPYGSPIRLVLRGKFDPKILRGSLRAVAYRRYVWSCRADSQLISLRTSVDTIYDDRMRGIIPNPTENPFQSVQTCLQDLTAICRVVDRAQAERVVGQLAGLLHM